MKKITLLGMFFLIFTSFMSLKGQWARTYGGNDYDGAQSIQQTNDGGFIVAGDLLTTKTEGYDIWVLKILLRGVS